jgi:Fic family protein
VFIHQRATWPAFTWDDQALNTALGAVRHEQGRLLGRMAALGFELQSEASLHALTAEVVKSSAIEGELLDPQEVRSSVARKLGLEVAGLRSSGLDVDGIVTMLVGATQEFALPLTAERLFDWHRELFPAGRNASGPITVGSWRTPDSDPMQVVSGPMGRQTVHFEAPRAARLDLEMARFLAWFDQPASIDPVLKAGIAHFWFVTVHPFDDGNGRIARAIAEMALARADGSRNRFYSMSSQIEAERADYYRRLEHSQRGGLDVTDWLSWFLGCLGRAIAAADQTLAATLNKARFWRHVGRFSLHARQRAVLNRMLDGFQGHLNTSKYAKLARCSADTALRDIQQLVELGILVRNPGGGRSTSYALVPW